MTASDHSAISVACESTAGGRAENQDRCYAETLDPAQSLWGFRAILVVADGMGGHEKGEQAAQLAVDVTKEVVAARLEDHGRFTTDFVGAEPTDVVRGAFERANARIYEWAITEDLPGDTGTTLSIVACTDEEVVVGNVGDSPVYIVTATGVQKLTEDDSWVAEEVRQGRMTEWEALRSPIRNQLTQAVGVDVRVEPHVRSLLLEPNCVFIACTDGLSEVVGPEAIREVVGAGGDVNDLCRALVALAVAAGSPDNVTVAALSAGNLPRPLTETEHHPATSLAHGRENSPPKVPTEISAPTDSREVGTTQSPSSPSSRTATQQRIARQRNQRLGTLLIVSMLSLFCGLLVGKFTIPDHETGGLDIGETTVVSEPPPQVPISRAPAPPEQPTSTTPSAEFVLEVHCEGDELLVTTSEDLTLDVYPRGAFADHRSRLLPLEGSPPGEARYRLPKTPPTEWYQQTATLRITRLGEGRLAISPEPAFEIFVDNHPVERDELAAVRPEGERARIGFHFPPTAREGGYAIAIAGFPVNVE
ncbi:MAG: PP2C family protein-serine/threonine phosphatase [Candidatus Zipacnadales bacterium]